MKNLNERFMGSPAIRSVLKRVPRVSHKELFEKAEPCDILVVYTPKSFLKHAGIAGRIKTFGMSFFQGSPYTSSKLIFPNKIVVGYGADPKRSGQEITSIKLDKYLRNLTDGCLVRVPDLKENQKSRIFKYINNRKNTPYDSSGILKAAWNRYTPNFMDIDIDEPETKKEITSYKKALYCSTLISMAFLSIGIKFLDDPLEVWPRDFILAPNAIKICRVEA